MMFQKIKDILLIVALVVACFCIYGIFRLDKEKTEIKYTNPNRTTAKNIQTERIKRYSVTGVLIEEVERIVDRTQEVVKVEPTAPKTWYVTAAYNPFTMAPSAGGGIVLLNTLGVGAEVGYGATSGFDARARVIVWF